MRVGRSACVLVGVHEQQRPVSKPAPVMTRYTTLEAERARVAAACGCTAPNRAAKAVLRTCVVLAVTPFESVHLLVCAVVLSRSILFNVRF